MGCVSGARPASIEAIHHTTTTDTMDTRQTPPRPRSRPNSRHRHHIGPVHASDPELQAVGHAVATQSCRLDPTCRCTTVTHPVGNDLSTTARICEQHTIHHPRMNHSHHHTPLGGGLRQLLAGDRQTSSVADNPNHRGQSLNQQGTNTRHSLNVAQAIITRQETPQ